MNAACGTPAIWQFRKTNQQLGSLDCEEVDDVRVKVGWLARFGVELLRRWEFRLQEN